MKKYRLETGQLRNIKKYKKFVLKYNSNNTWLSKLSLFGSKTRGR